MRSKTYAVVAALVLAACSGCTGQAIAGHGEPAGLAASSAGVGATAGASSTSGAGASATAGASSNSSASTAHTSAELTAVLLGIDDIGGSGWSVVPDTSSDDSDSDDSTCGSDDLDDQAHEAEAEFSRGTLGPFLDENLVSASSAVVAKSEFAKVIDTFRTCSGVTESDGSKATVTDMSFPTFGDQSRAYRILESVPESSTSPGDDSVDSSIPADVVIVQDGRLLELFLYVALTGGATSDLQSAVKNGVTRAHLLR